MALAELGRPLTTNANKSAVSQAVDRIRLERIGHFREADWQRFRVLHGRKADLALLETVMLEDIRDGKIASDRPRDQRKQIKDLTRYLHGILARLRVDCRPQVTLGRLLVTWKRAVPPSTRAEISAHDAERQSVKSFISGRFS